MNSNPSIINSRVKLSKYCNDHITDSYAIASKMDIFKVLARSTRLQKSSPSTEDGWTYDIPSAGPSHPTQDAHKRQSILCAREAWGQRGMKRKRGDAVDQKSSNMPRSLNFFGNSPKSSMLEKMAIASFNDIPVNAQRGDGQHAQLTTLNLDEAECSRILKRNKVKITILRQQDGLQDKQTHRSTGSHTQRHDKSTNKVLLPQPLTCFEQLRGKYGVSRRLAESLDAQGYSKPTEVQLGSLPLLLGSDEQRGLGSQQASKGTNRSGINIDLLTIAPTGSGKTLAFMLYLLHNILQERPLNNKDGYEKRPGHQIQALIIAPTHELVEQIVNEGKKLAVDTGIKVSGLKRGMRLYPLVMRQDQSENSHGRFEQDIDEQPRLETGHGPESNVKSDILVSTPLLLLHAMQSPGSTILALPGIRFLVLDEADVLLDPIFREPTLSIWGACSGVDLQTTLWSATIGSSIESLAQTFILERRRRLGLHNPEHRILRLVVGLKDSAAHNISHCLTYAASEQGKLLALRQLIHPSIHPSAMPTDSNPSVQPPFLVFTQTISRATALHSELLYDIPLEAGGSSRMAVLHSDFSVEQRSKIMARFREGEIWILITTDLLSRGIDFRGINGVVNYDIPNTGASYVHRVGRAGRQGREGGIAVTLYTKEDIPYVKNVANVIAATEKAKQQSGKVSERGMQKWLLDALPDLHKKVKQDLKRRGVESRRATPAANGKEARRTRISTKSGYDRQIENKKKGAIKGSQKRLTEVDDHYEAINMEEWNGIDT